MPSLDQQGIWEQEHSNPLVLPQMDKQDASRGVADFFTWLVQKRPHERLAGVEMGCGKGRNCLWLARQGFKMTGFDFSKNAIEEAKKRDHRKLGQELDLFTFSPLVGPGLPLFTPRGTLIRRLLDEFVWELARPYGYERVNIPHLAKVDLYKTSGHWDKFSEQSKNHKHHPLNN